MLELKPCPICGGSACVVEYLLAPIGKRPPEYAVECYSCGCSSRRFKTQSEAVNAWNGGTDDAQKIN